jgi:hypothetical protein
MAPNRTPLQCIDDAVPQALRGPILPGRPEHSDAQASAVGLADVATSGAGAVPLDGGRLERRGLDIDEVGPVVEGSGDVRGLVDLEPEG